MKKVGIVLSSTLMLAGFVAAPVAVGFSARTATATGPTVTLQIKTLTKTLLGPTKVRGKTGWITKGGTPVGKCSGASAAGALDTATHGRWAGKYYPSLRDIFVTSILHVKPAGSDYWGIYVNGKVSSTGICGIKLHAGERLLFKIVK
jgi:hypothetical protein